MVKLLPITLVTTLLVTGTSNSSQINLSPHIANWRIEYCLSNDWEARVIDELACYYEEEDYEVTVYSSDGI